MNRFVHFELVTGDPEKTAEFYRAVFGWQVQKWDGPVEYWLVNTGDTSTPGINGGLMLAGGEFGGTINTIEVADIDATLASIRANGGSILSDKQHLEGVGDLAYFKDNCGIIIGLLQPEPMGAM